MPEKEAVLLLAHGSPEKPEDVPAFMRNITGGRPISPETMQEVEHRYGLIGSSPLLKHTRAQGEGLERLLGLPVYIGMRNWHPYIPAAVQQMLADGATRVEAAREVAHQPLGEVGDVGVAVAEAGVCHVDRRPRAHVGLGPVLEPLLRVRIERRHVVRP